MNKRQFTFTTLNSINPSDGWYGAIPLILKSTPSLPITESFVFSESHFSIKSKHSYNTITKNKRITITTNPINQKKDRTVKY